MLLRQARHDRSRDGFRGNKDDAILLQKHSELWAGYGIEIPLPPGRAPVRVIFRNCLKLSNVVTEMNNQMKVVPATDSDGRRKVEDGERSFDSDVSNLLRWTR